MIKTFIINIHKLQIIKMQYVKLKPIKTEPKYHAYFSGSDRWCFQIGLKYMSTNDPTMSQETHSHTIKSL